MKKTSFGIVVAALPAAMLLGFASIARAQYVPATPPPAPPAPETPQAPPAPETPQAPQAPQAPPQQPYPQQPYPQQPYPQQPYPQQPYPQQPYQPYPQYPPYAHAAYGPPPGYHEHDGFYFRGAFGMGPGASKARASNTEFTGIAGALTLAFGAAVAPNFIVYGELGGVVWNEPEEESPNFSGKATGVSVSTSSVGVGFTYYLMPSNIYLSGTLSLNTLTIEVDDVEIESTNGGLGLSLKAGREWWVSHNWGLGFYFGIDVATMTSKDSSVFAEMPTWRSSAATFGFSATYN